MHSLFPVFDPIDERLLYYKARHLVHVDGDWHKGVQANIIRPNSHGSFDILLQRRSGSVDIGLGKYDQSLATQMLDEDELSETKCLQRGLEQELGVTSYRAYRLPASLRIVKRYIEQPECFNRELISLFTVIVDGQQPRNNSPKIDSLEWIEWASFGELFAKSPERFTKTAQFYFGDPRLAQIVELAALFALNGKPLPQAKALPQPLLRIDCPPEAAYTLEGNLRDLLSRTEDL